MAAFALWSMAGPSVARGDWEIHRSPAAASKQMGRDFAEHPERRDLAERLLRGRSGAEVARLLRGFEEVAARAPADFRAQLAYAQLLLAAKQWEPAAVAFERAAGISPQSVAARWGRARALGGAGGGADSRAELRVALALSRTPSDIQQVARALVVAAANAGDAEAEVEGRRALVALRPAAREVFELAAALNGAGRPDEAARVLSERAPENRNSGAESARWYLAEGKYRAAAGDLEAAALALGHASRATPRRALRLREEVWAAVVDVARRRGTLDEVARALSAPVDVVDWVARARVADEQGDLRGAWRAVAEAVRLSPRNLDLRKREIALARRVGTLGEVAVLHEQLATFALVSGDPAVMVDALDGLWEMRRPEVAGRVVDRVLARGQGAGVPMLRAVGEAAGRWGDDRRAERCWTALLRRTPGDELALVALGEIHLQRGQRRLALETWRSVLGGVKRGARAADGHARLAEILVDHDLQEQALSEARLAVTGRPAEPRYHRLLATILERQARLAAAETEWEAVLRLARGAAQAPARNEARMRLIGLWMRAGSGRVETKLREMEEVMARDTRDRETLVFLVQAQVRTGRTEAALALMQRALGEVEGTMTGATHASEDDADLMLLLVRTLRQLHRTDEAMRWLEQLSRRFPARAREARIQLAELALGEHADRRAQDYADQAAISTGGDGRVLLRAAAVQERLGHSDQAATMYRRLLETGHHDAAGLALASLLARRGEIEEQRALLRGILRDTDDDEMAASAGKRAIVLEEASGGLDSLESFVADTPDLNGETAVAAARRRVLAAILWRVVPDAYRNQWQEPTAAAKLRLFARHGVRALLELADAPDAVPDAKAVEVLGMLGRADAVPALARLLVPGLGDGVAAAGSSSTLQQANSGAPPFVLKDDLAAVTIVALGRLGGDPARRALEAYAEHEAPGVRLSLLWALGRVGGGLAIRRALSELERNATDAAVVACLTLGRAGDAGEGDGRLIAVAEDPLRPAAVRVAAVLGLGVGRHRVATSLLRRLSATADPALGSAARTALGFMDGSVTVPDDGAAILGSHIDPDALLFTLQGASIPFSAWRPDVSASPADHGAEGWSGGTAPRRRRSGPALTCRKPQRRMPCQRPVPGYRNEIVHGDERRKVLSQLRH